MGMTARGHKNLGGNRTVINPFMPGGEFQRITIEVDNAYNRGYIPPFSLWAPSNYSTTAVVKYLPFIPPITIRATDTTSYYDIDNEWHDYFRAGDELIALDISGLSSDQVFIGQEGSTNDTDLTTVTLSTMTITVSGVGERDSGGTGETRIIVAEMLDATSAAGVIGTGDVLVLAGADTTTSILAYAQSSRVVIMEQAFNFQDPTDGLAPGNGGVLLESAVYSYTGTIDQNHVQYYTYLNTLDASPAVATGTRFVNGNRFNFRNVWRG
jgi:hypothetical protein